MRNFIRVAMVGGLLLSSTAFAVPVSAQTTTSATDGAQYVSATLPSKFTFVPGESISMTITAKNTGTSVWNSAMALWPYPGNSEQYAWTTNSGWSLPRTVVNPGEEATFNLEFRAPQTPQTTSFQWRMTRDMPNGLTADQSKFFGDLAPASLLTLTVANPATFKILDFKVDKVDALGNSAEDVRSFGWSFSSDAKDVNFEIRKKSTNEIFYTKHFDTWGTVRIYNSPGDWTKKLEPNTTYTYSLSAAAATSVAGATSDRVTGEFTTSNFPVANIDNAHFVEGSFPTQTTFKPGENVKVLLRVQNTGTTSWRATGQSPSYYLAGVSPVGYGKDVAIPIDRYPNETVAPSQTVQFAAYVTLPTIAGTYSYQWRMTRDDDGPGGTGPLSQFGDFAPSTPLVWTVAEQLTPNNPPVIQGITAPSVLSVREAGTWTIKAYDPESEPLSYYATWGDEYPGAAKPASISASSYGQSQNATFTHYYTQPGVYEPRFTVIDSADQKADTSASVTINESTRPPEPVVPTGSMKITVVNGDIWCIKASCGVLKNAKVAVYALDGDTFREFMGSSDTNGGAAGFYNIPVGRYVAYASVPNFNEAKRAFTIRAGRGDYLTIRLSAIRETLTCPPDCPDIIDDVFVPTLPDGSLIQLVRTKGVFYIENGQKRPIRSRAVFDARGFDLSDVIIVDRTDFDRYPTGEELTRDGRPDGMIEVFQPDGSIKPIFSTRTLQEGSLVKALNDKSVYRIEGGKRRAFLSGSVFEARGFYWSDIVVVGPESLGAYPLGDMITYQRLGDGFLIKSPRRPEVFWTENGQKRHIANESVFAAHAFRWQDIHVISDDEIASYSTGSNMDR